MARYYGVANGRSKGVFSSWDNCKPQVNGYSGAQVKGFSSKQEARAYANQGPSAGSSKSSGGGSSGGSGGSGSGAARQSHSGSSNASKSGGQHNVIYTDGSALGNGQSGSKAGWGVYWGPGDSRNAAGKVKHEQTSSRAESQAIKQAVQQIHKETAKGSKGSYEIRTDSHEARDALGKQGSKSENNSRNTTSGVNVKNRDIVEPTRRQMETLHNSGVNVTVSHVPGHANHSGNVAADSLARGAASSD